MLSTSLPSPESTANVLEASGTLDPARSVTEVWLADGRVVRLETALLLNLPQPAPVASSAALDRDGIIIPVIKEELVVSKQVVETARVRLIKTVQTYQETLNEPLAVREYDIERVILNQPVDSAPPPRQEGETTVYPLVEERMILTKQLVLREELRVTRRDTERRDQQVVTLEREHITIEREIL